MIQFKAFEVLISIISGARKRATAEHLDFLEFYKAVIGIVDNDIAREFGSIPVPTMVSGKEEATYRLELNATDLMWWRSVIVSEHGRFKQGVDQVQRDIWDRLVKQAGSSGLNEEQRQQLLDITFESST